MSTFVDLQNNIRSLVQNKFVSWRDACDGFNNYNASPEWRMLRGEEEAWYVVGEGIWERMSMRWKEKDEGALIEDMSQGRRRMMRRWSRTPGKAGDGVGDTDQELRARQETEYETLIKDTGQSRRRSRIHWLRTPGKAGEGVWDTDRGRRVRQETE